jgi:transposase
MKLLVSAALRQRLRPLLPPPSQRRFCFPDRKPLAYCQIVTGILFVLKTGIAWDDLPAELGCGCARPAATTSGPGTRPAFEGSCTPCCWPN